MTTPVEPAQVPAAPVAPAAPAVSAPVAPATPPAPAAPAAPAVPVDNAPKWDGDFDPERAARLVENLRNENQSMKDKVSAFEQAQMSDQEKVAERAKNAETQLAEANRKIAMLTHSIPEDLADFLTGSTAEEIDGQAKRLAARIAAATPTDATPAAMPATLPIPGNGADPAAVSQLTREQLEALSPADQLKAYREGRTRTIGGR